MHTLLRCLLPVIFLCSAKLLRAQNYPVQLSVQLLPPFSGYLPDYTVAASEQLRAFVVFNDFSVASYNIKLKFSLQGQGITMQSPSWYFMGPVNVQPGVPALLSGSDLAPLISVNNLQFTGITPQQYNQQKVLPEGLYTICITAYDFANPVPIQVSNEACLQVWMGINDPPLLNFPLCESEVNIITPQNITFSWTPLNMNGPTSQQGTEYDFELYEVRPANNPPGNVLLTQAPIYTITTSQTMIMYGIAEPPLIPGMEYVWRVRARDGDGRPLFRNNGWSQYCTFTWGNSLSVLGNLAALQLTAQAQGARQALAQWDSLSVYASYRLQFRKQNTANWFPQTTNTRTARVNGLEPQTTYEAQVVGILPNGNEGPVSNTVLFTTAAVPVFVCGQTSLAPNMQAFQPLTQATTGMIWQVGQFEMSVLSLANNVNSAGFYTGTGRIVMPMGISVGCTFNGIQIGQDFKMYSGEVRAMSEGIGNWLQGWVSSGMWNVNYTYNGTIDSLYLDNNGNIVIISGNDTTIITPTEFPYTVQDENGNVYTVYANGNIVYQNAIPHVPLSEDQKDIYRAAFTRIRNKHTVAYMNTLRDSMNTARQAHDLYITQTLGLSGDTSAPVSDDVFVTFMEYDSTDVNLQASPQELERVRTEYNYIRAQVLKVFCADPPTADDFNLLANYLIIGGQPSHEYLAAQLALGTDENLMIDQVELAIYRLIENTLNNSAFKKPQ